ncbi:MAG: PAS domain-containing protein [Gemmatimonadales bacterium]
MQRSAAELLRSVVDRLTATTSRSMRAVGHAAQDEDIVQRLLRHVPGMVFRGEADAARTMEIVSAGSRDLTGFGPNELVWGRVVSYGALIHPDDRRRVQEELSRAVLTGRPYRIDYRIRRVDGRERRVRELGQPVPRDRGGVALEGYVADLDTDVLAGGEQEAVFRELGEHYNAGVYIVRDDRFEYVNGRLADIFGYARSELLALSSVKELVHPDDREAVAQQQLIRLAGGADGLPYEFRGRRKDGAEVAIEAISQRLQGPHAPAIAGALVDVTERRKGDRRVGETRTLEALARFSTHLAHDLNNVLATIKGTAQALLSERSGDAVLAGDLQEMVAAVDRGASLGRQLIEFGRSRPAGDAVVSLARVIAALEPILSRALGSSITLRVEIDASDPLARIDAVQAEEMLTVLAVHARQAMPDGGVLTLKVTESRLVPFRAGMSAGPYVVLEASDTGPGLPAELQGRLLEPSFGPTSGRAPGLARLWRLAHDAGGCVDVESEPGSGKGTTVRVTLPAAQPL